MNELLTPEQVRALQAENLRLRETLARLEETLAWLQQRLKELAE